MSFRNGIPATKLPLTAFADDTNLLGNDDARRLTVHQLVDQAKRAFQLWDKLLHATGHFMELGKCACYLSIWDFQEDGFAYTIPPEELNIEIRVQDVTGANQVIPQLSSDTSQKTLGVMKNPIGNQQDEVSRLQKKSDQIAMRMNSRSLTHADAFLAYEAFYIPAMRYSLAITAINQLDFEKIQGQATTAFLAAMGYNRNMPRQVVYAPKIYQGLGLRHLFDLQGCDGTRLLLQEINMKGSSTREMLKAVLETIQLESGIGSPIFEDTRPLDYLEWGWIPQIRDFLHHIDGQIQGATDIPLRYRANDQYIMDSELLRTMTYKERMLIHRCRVFLQVEVLSDISDAMGEFILPEWMDPTPEKSSYSTKKWPKQANPGQEAWKIWQKFIKGAYTTSSGKLRTALGKWTQINEFRVHNHYSNESHTMLYSRGQDGRWEAHTRRWAGRRCLIFNSESTPIEELPQYTIPIDVKTKTDQNIVTSIGGLLDLSKSHQADTNTFSAIIENQKSLRVDKITLLVEEHEISETLKNPTRFEIASDGGFDPSSGISSHGWAVALNRMLIAKGRGPVEAHPDLAESFRSEGYGLASVSAFLQEMIKYFNISTSDHSWKFYLDNKAMIQRMESYRNIMRHSQWNLRSDADITNTANEYLQEIPTTFVHVKSHQDSEKDNQMLTFDAHMNIIADAMATQQRECMSKPVTRVTSDSCLLVIKGRYITRDTKRWLIQSAGEVPIQSYYQAKYGWTRAIFHSIHWELQHKTLKSYKLSDQRRLLKFVHEWLPTNLRLFREGQDASPACSLCGSLEESNDHILECPYPQQQQTRSKLSDYLWKDNENHGNSELNNIIEIALTECTHNTDWTPAMLDISHALTPCIKHQNKIGWHQLYKGRIAKSMIHFMEAHYRQLSVDTKRYTGERWGKMLLQNIWNTILQLWAQRNEAIHGTKIQRELETERTRLHYRVQQYYDKMDKLDIGDRDKIFYKDREQMLQEDTRYIKAWLKLAQRAFSTAKKEQAAQGNSRKLMETYFAWKPSNRNHRHQTRTPRSPAETHPD
jgi:hypothetical protein